MKKTTPGLVIVADALYCCSPVIEMCRRNDWRFIFTFREGRTPDVYAASRPLNREYAIIRNIAIPQTKKMPKKNTKKTSQPPACRGDEEPDR